MLVEHSTLEPSITCPYVTNTDAQTYDVIVKGSTVGNIEVKKLEMTNSKAGTIKIYGSVGNVIGNVTLENNVIDDFGFCSVTNFEDTVSNCVLVNTRIVNNTFNNSFTCPFYVGDSSYEFISRTGAHSFYYKGNKGNCPVDYAQLVTTLPYTDGAYLDAEEKEWGLELSNTVRLFIPGSLLVSGTDLKEKMVSYSVNNSFAVNVIPRGNTGLFHAGSLESQSNDYFLMCLASDVTATNNATITTINL